MYVTKDQKTYKVTVSGLGWTYAVAAVHVRSKLLRLIPFWRPVYAKQCSYRSINWAQFCETAVSDYIQNKPGLQEVNSYWISFWLSRSGREAEAVSELALWLTMDTIDAHLKEPMLLNEPVRTTKEVFDTFKTRPGPVVCKDGFMLEAPHSFKAQGVVRSRFTKTMGAYYHSFVLVPYTASRYIMRED